MNSRNYLLKITAGEADASRVWNARKPIVVGHPLRWVISREEKGVRIRSLAAPELFAETFGKKALAEHFVKDSDLAEGGTIVLAAAGATQAGLKVELRAARSVAAAHAVPESNGTSLRIFRCKGEWAIDSLELAGAYVGSEGAVKLFDLKGNSTGIYAPTETLELHARVDGVKVGEKALAKGERRSVAFSELSGETITYGESSWRLAASRRVSAADALTAATAVDSEQILFSRTLKGALAATVAAGLIAFLLPTTAPEEKKDETVHILLSQKKKIVKGFATAAPKGDPRAKDLSIGKKGVAKNAGKKGSSMAVAKHESGAPKAATHPVKEKAKSVAQAAPRAAAKSAPSATKHSNPSVAKTPSRSKAIAAARPVPVAHSELFKTLASSSLRKATAGLLSGNAVHGGSAGSSAALADARSLGTAGGSGRGALGGAGGVSTRSASVSGFGGGGSGDGDGGPGSAGAGYGRGSYAKVSGQGKSFVSLDTGASDVDEGLDRDAVGKVIAAHMNEIRYCYDSAQLRANNLSGTVMMKFAIGAPGTVQRAGVGSSTVGSRELHDCITARLKGWQFPKPRGGVTVAVAYPFNFKKITR